MKWAYGEVIFEDFPEFRSKWSDDLEVGLRVADQYFDYLWDITDNGEIHLTDRLYSQGESDRLTKERDAAGELTLSFKDPSELFAHFFPQMQAILTEQVPEFTAAVEYMAARTQDLSQKKVSTMKAVNIEWDVDSDEDKAQLPVEIAIPYGMENEEEISDYLSNVTGFCHKGFYLTDCKKVSLDDQIRSATSRVGGEHSGDKPPRMDFSPNH